MPTRKTRLEGGALSASGKSELLAAYAASDEAYNAQVRTAYEKFKTGWAELRRLVVSSSRCGRVDD